MKKKWLWMAAAILVVAVIVLVLRLTVFAPETDPDPDPTPTPSDTTTTTTAPVEDVVTPASLHFDGKVLEVDGDSVLMECYDKEKFDTVWVNIAAVGTTLEVGDVCGVIYEDLVMPSLPPRITAEIIVPPTISSEDYERVPLENGKLIVMGKELSEGTQMVYCKNTLVENSDLILLPFAAVLRAAGAEISWQSDTVAEVVYKDNKTILDTEQCRMYEVGGQSEEYILEAPGGILLHQGVGENFLLDRITVRAALDFFGIPVQWGEGTHFHKGVVVLESAE